MEQVYRLNLPSLDNILISDFSWYNDNDMKYNYISDNIDGVIKSDMKNFLGFKWNTFRYFKKSEMHGSIHSDLDNITNLDDRCVWGINWIIGGDGALEFWNWDNVKHVGVTSGAINNPKLGIAPKFTTNKKADYFYHTKKDEIYLVNASLPHRASGMKNRKAFSLRVDTIETPWTEVVDRFRNYIIN